MSVPPNPGNHPMNASAEPATPVATPLFRSAVSSRAGHRRYGTVLLARPVSYAFLTLLFVAMTAALVLFFTFFSYTRKAQIPGVLLPSDGLIRVVPLQAGVVTERPLGLLEPTSGEVLIGGVKLRSLGLANYRQIVGTVMQEDQLFARSIADNISFFDPDANQGLVASCARLAAIHDEIAAMPMGYDTLVGDIGSGLSGGRRQRLLLARSLYKSSRLLFLDEATSHLDIWNEQLVNAAIKQIALTRILVAHRPETIAMAKRVIVVDQGRVVRDLEQPSTPGGPRHATAAGSPGGPVEHANGYARATG